MGGESSIPVRVGHLFFILSRISCLLYCASHKNWIRNIRFSIMNRPLSQ